MRNDVLRELVLGLWKIHILHHAMHEGVVGHHLLRELREHGYDVSPGTLYPLLHRMKRSGLLESTPADPGCHGAHRYDITPLGAEVLRKVRNYVAELHRELGSATQSNGHEQSRSSEQGDGRNE